MVYLWFKKTWTRGLNVAMKRDQSDFVRFPCPDCLHLLQSGHQYLTAAYVACTLICPEWVFLVLSLQVTHDTFVKGEFLHVSLFVCIFVSS